jgi:serine O-acetyltransferase
MMSFFQVLKCDLLRHASSNNKFNFFKVTFFNHAFHLVFFIRIGVLFRSIPLIGGVLGILIEYFIRIFFSSDISCKAKIGPGLMIMHGHDIVIGSNVVIGKNCKIFNGVTLGNKYTEVPDNSQPTVGDDVVISTGAKILGDVLIGNNVIIGANSVVLISIQSGCVAVGVPAKIIKLK